MIHPLKCIIGTLALAVVASAQSIAGDPRFEVATIKPNKSGSGLTGGACHGTDSKFGSALGIEPPSLGRCSFRNVTLKTLIQEAYGVSPFDTDRVSGGPKWLDGDRFDFEAKASAPGTLEQMRAMLRSVLADRFQLKLRQEAKEIGGYTLVVAKAGPKLTPSPENAERKGLQRLGGGPFVAQGASMAQLAKTISLMLAQPVEDQTGLTGVYDFTLTTATSDASADALLSKLPPEIRAQLAPRDPTGPSIFTAVQEQLGLKLDPRKLPLQVYVVDSAEKPSGN